jgi:hypothetical protein
MYRLLYGAGAGAASMKPTARFFVQPRYGGVAEVPQDGSVDAFCVSENEPSEIYQMPKIGSIGAHTFEFPATENVPLFETVSGSKYCHVGDEDPPAIASWTCLTVAAVGVVVFKCCETACDESEAPGWASDGATGAAPDEQPATNVAATNKAGNQRFRDMRMSPPEKGAKRTVNERTRSGNVSATGQASFGSGPSYLRERLLAEG